MAKPPPGKRIDFAKLAEKAIKEAVSQVVKEHEKSGRPLHVWEDGKVVALSAKTLRKRPNEVVRRPKRKSPKALPK
jgi:hypothetical protein